MLICALGDLLLDVVVRLDTPLNLGADATARTRTGAGGQAANVAAWATELGAQGRLVAKRASDAAGELVVQELADHGVGQQGTTSGQYESITPDDDDQVIRDEAWHRCPTIRVQHL